MGKRNKENRNKKLGLNKETLRQLRVVADADLGQAAGGMHRPPPTQFQPSINGC